MVELYVDKLQEEEFVSRIRMNSSFSLCFTNNITDKFMENYRNRDSGVYWVYGSTGSGKSSLAIALAVDKQRNFNGSKQIVMTNDELKNVVYSSKEGDVFIRDETVKDFGEGSGQMISTIQDLTETLRQRQNSFFLLSPVIKGQPFVHYYLEVLQCNVPLDAKSMKKYIGAGNTELFFRVGVQDKNLHYLGYILVSVEVNSHVWVDYQKKKNDFLEKMASGERTSGLDYTAQAEKFLEIIDFEKYSKKGERRVFIKQNSNFTNSQVLSIHVEMERLISERGLIKKKKDSKPVWDSKIGVMRYE